MLNLDAGRFSREGIEHLRDIAVAADGGQFGIRTEGDSVEALAIADQVSDGLAGPRIPQSRGAILLAVVAAGEHGEAIGTERKGIDESRMWQGREQFAAGHVPELRALVTASDHSLAVG